MFEENGFNALTSGESSRTHNLVSVLPMTLSAITSDNTANVFRR